MQCIIFTYTPFYKSTYNLSNYDYLLSQLTDNIKKDIL